MKVRYLETEKSIGRVICHDITKIEKGVFKGALFKKGHCIREEDIKILLDLGKKHIYSIKLEPGDLHEDEAGVRIARALKGPSLDFDGPSEGRLDLKTRQRGLLKVDVPSLTEINNVSGVIVSTLHTNSPVEAMEKVAGAKVIPLVVAETVVHQVEAICGRGKPVISVLPYLKAKVGLVITGCEVIEGRIKDGFAAVLQQKAVFFGLDEPVVLYAEDDADVIAARIGVLLSRQCNLIVVTGGMSVDPDDVTPLGIKKAGAAIVKYGAPVLPGAMFLLGYHGSATVIGLPACAMYHSTTILDILLPRIMIGEKVASQDIVHLGHGGLCRRCEKCFFPSCSFGKGAM